jgi:bifunctional DNA-binding transcriptional regulator/antitoxin component of YhaV-PrlF toxin-antitoxin module
MRVTSKGRVPIALEVRRKLGIEPGSDVEFELDDRGARLVRIKTAQGTTIARRMRGRGTVAMSTEQIMALPAATDSSPVAGTLVDSNVPLDLSAEDPHWCDRSEARLADALDRGVTREALPWEAAFPAGRSFLEYRRRGGRKRSPLPDFYVGAHAAVTGRALLTRDARRCLSLFGRAKSGSAWRGRG